MCMNVDLPDPEGPVAATNSPCAMSTDTPRNAWTLTSPTSYVLVRSRTEMTGGILPTASCAATRTARTTSASALPAAGEPASILLESGRKCRASRVRCGSLCSGHDAGDHVIAVLELALNELRLLSIRDAEA